MKRDWTWLLLLAQLAAGGCKSRPSATIPNSEAPHWSLAAPPVLVIGASDTSRSAVLGRVAGALRLSNGSIVVADVDPPELKLFDSTGRYLRTIGRTGSGPAEFRWPGSPQQFAGDSFYVVDVEQRRVSFFDGAGNPALTRRFQLQLADGRSFLPVGVLSSSQFVAMLSLWRYPRRLGERVRPSVEIVSGTFGSPGFRPIARGRGDEVVGGTWHEAGSTTVVGYPLEFGSRTQVAVGAGRVYLGETAVPRIEVFDLTGRSIGLISWDSAPDPVTETDRRARIAQESTRVAAIPSGPDPAQLGSELEHLRTVKLPRQMPAFTSLLAAADGSLWVEQDPRPWTAARRYLVFDSAGALLASATIPRQLQPYQIGAAFLLGRWRDPGEADQVRLYRLSR